MRNPYFFVYRIVQPKLFKNQMKRGRSTDTLTPKGSAAKSVNIRSNLSMTSLSEKKNNQKVTRHDADSLPEPTEDPPQGFVDHKNQLQTHVIDIFMRGYVPRVAEKLSIFLTHHYHEAMSSADVADNSETSINTSTNDLQQQLTDMFASIMTAGSELLGSDRQNSWSIQNSKKGETAPLTEQEATRLMLKIEPFTEVACEVTEELNTSEEVKTIRVGIPSNTNLLRQIRLLKKEAFVLVSHLTDVHHFLGLNVPPFKLSDNVGVEVLGAIGVQMSNHINELQEKCGFSMESSYLADRAVLEMARFRNPRSVTTLRSVVLHDVEAWEEVRKGWALIAFTALHVSELIRKNWNIVTNPRSEEMLFRAV